MKKIVLWMFALLAICSTAYGDNSITIQAISLPQNTEADLVVGFSFDDQEQFTGYSFKIQLPEGVEFVADGEDAAYEVGDCYDVKNPPTIKPYLLSNDLVSVGVMSQAAFTKNSGVLLTLKIKLTSTSTLGVGTTVQGELSDAKIVKIVPNGATNIPVDGSSFDITIAEAILPTILDETSETAPEASGNAVDIIVKRTIDANMWSTICLPFAMTEDQVKSAFGEDVQFAEFIDYDYDPDLDKLTVNFETLDIETGNGIEANCPYIIKTSKEIKQFEVKSIIEPDKEKAKAEYDNGLTGRRRQVYGTFQGTYIANTLVPEYSLFISDNKFYYSRGTTKMKAFRGYFTFVDLLEDIENAGARAMITFNDGNTTRIQNADFVKTKTGRVYSVTGRYMGENVNMKTLPKGVYVVDGVKVINN